MALDDLDQILDPGLEVTVLGRVYKLPLADALLGLWCRRLAMTASELSEVSEDSTDEELAEAAAQAEARAADLPKLPGMDTKTFEEIMLGDELYQRFIDDKMPDPYVKFCARTAYIQTVADEEAAVRYYNAGGRPERMARGNRASRRAATNGKTSSGLASVTPTPGSTSGMPSPTRSNNSGRGRRSRGRRS